MDVDSAEFEAVVDRFYEPLYRFALSLARRDDAAADLTQETFYLWASRGHQLRDRTKAKAWLFTTLHREFLRQRRHHGRFVEEELDEVEGELPAVEEVVGQGIDAGRAMEALQQVEEVFRVPLTLFYVEDFSYREIAEALELPIGTVMSRLSRGKIQLRRHLATPATGGDAAETREDGDERVIPFRRGAQAGGL